MSSFRTSCGNWLYIEVELVLETVNDRVSGIVAVHVITPSSIVRLGSDLNTLKLTQINRNLKAANQET
jgi:hypothetical protein